MKAIDLQVNGYAGVDFNGPDLTAAALHKACAALREDGVGGVLAAVITDSLDAMCSRLRAIAAMREADPLCAEVILGIHVEGPFLNAEPGYIGAHPPEHARAAKRDDMARLVDAAGGLVKLVTLAPERDPGLETTRWLASRDITVAAGHCDPTERELRAAIDAGLSMFTHLGNGCPMQLHRHDNIIQRALSASDELFVSVIPDGTHVPFPTLANYLKVIPPGRAVAVTDAISAARLPPGRYTLGRWELDIGEDLVAMAPDGSHFVGSTATMPRVIENLRQHLGLPDDAVDAMVRANPARAIGIDA